MRQKKYVYGLMCGTLLSGMLLGTTQPHAEEGYPDDYTPSKPAEQGETNVLARALAATDYMNAKLTAAGGKNSPMCYRNCLTVPLNEILACLETNNTYVSSASCEKDAAQKMAACDPKCQ